jgi:ribulose bisphosphate carboxylase small subunit
LYHEPRRQYISDTDELKSNFWEVAKTCVEVLLRVCIKKLKKIANLHSAQPVRQHKFDTSKKRKKVGYIAA